MKKIFTSLAVLSLITGTAMAQAPSADLSIEFISPTDGQQFANVQPNDSVVFTFVLTNNGPDALAAGDTVVVAYNLDWCLNQAGYAFITSADASTLNCAQVGGTDTFTQAIYQNGDLGGGFLTTIPSDATVSDITVSTYGFTASPSGNFLFDDPGSDVVGGQVSLSENNEDTLTLTFGNATGIHQIAGDNTSLSVYPNPTSNNISVKYNFDNATNSTIRIMDMFGRTLITKDLGKQVGEQTFQLNTSSLAQGMYILELAADDARSTTRFSVVK